MVNHIFIREAKNEDLEEVFNLSNQDYVRKYSISKEKINWKNHVKWFQKTMDDPDSVFYIVSNEVNQFLGQIRYNIEDKSAKVSISLSHLITGKRYSRRLLLESMQKLFQDRENVHEIIAYVSEENVPSIKLFEKAGFSPIEKGELCKYRYIKKEENN